MATHKCKHGHSLLQHYACYQPTTQRIGFLDIEASNLDADFGIILSYCIKELGSDELHEATLDPADIASARAGDEDKQLVKQLVTELGAFDKVVTYYGSRFDIPFIRTRALMTGVPFPVYGTLHHQDLYFTLRNRFKLSSNRLENACRTILGKTQKTRIENRFWRGGVRGDEKSLAYIADHNRKDVYDLERLYKKVLHFSRQQNVSL